MVAVRYKLPVDVYPRFKFFRSRLSCIVPRLQRLVDTKEFKDAREFTTCISQGSVKLQDIIQSATSLQEEVTVSVIEEGASIPSDFLSKLQVKDLTSDVEQENVQESAIMENIESTTKFHPHFLIYLMTNPSFETVEHISIKHPQQGNVLIYDIATGNNFLMEDPLEAMFEELSSENKNIGKQVQYLLEDRVVGILENIVDFSKHFAPKTLIKVMENDLLDECSRQVENSLRCKFVMDDLDPEKVPSPDTSEYEIIETDDMRIGEINLEALDAIKTDQEQDKKFSVNVIKTDQEAEQDKKSSVNVIKTDQEQDKKFSVNVIKTDQKAEQDKKFSVNVIKTDQEADQDKKFSVNVIKTDQEQDKKFSVNLLDYLTRKTRCCVCEYLSKKYKVRAASINEFLNEGFFDYNKKYKEDWNSRQKPTWSSMERRNVWKIIVSYIRSQQIFFSGVEDYIKDLLQKRLMGFYKLNFEVFGLLQKTQVPVLTFIPVYPEMPPDMQSELLSLVPDVLGCGTIYGILTIHVRENAGEPLHKTIKEVLTQRRYYHGYRVQTLLHRNHHVLPEPEREEIKSGKRIKATHTQEALQRYNLQGKSPAEHKIGTLGCFIVLRKETSEDDMEIEKAGGDTSSMEEMEDLFGITCAHCVTDSHSEVEVMHNDGYQTLGHIEVCHDDGQRIDIAAVRITPENRPACNIQVCFRNWELYDEKAHDADTVASVVYKDGAATGTTEGIVISNDYKPNVRTFFRDDVIDEANAKGGNFDGDYNILIDIKDDNHNSTIDDAKKDMKFSEAGDSGSVVYFLEHDRVIMMSLLEGSMSIRDQVEGDMEWTYSSHLKRCLEHLCKEKGYRLEIPWSTSLPKPDMC